MSTLNVLRYSALALGIAVGVKNDWSLKASAKDEAANKKLQHELELVEKAKTEYKKLNPPPKKQANVENTKFDLEDPNFDIAAAILGSIDSLKQ
ncbi:HCL402Cp [Eremothecium sinecaudum]|uniref:ATP synthase F(0) complex subunit e, mitochondrial n=1 Tax=Eremothecium sinecaudum TaxID=45286 RepID=A0A109UYA0_9SACH|nr:HCL402Cp [Eremothecium sinecaudum]AMD19749.1 HCL402Cp [Eremothecium sinecaudum]